jgi:DNA helicase II / ATP-dependent DNA helicase PcrA
VPAPLDGLDDAQRAAATHAGGPLLVLGGPGTGKTRVLVRRAAWLASEGVSPDALLVLAATRAGADAMRAELETLVEAPYEGLRVATFHDFCAGLLRDEALEAGLDPFVSPVSAADRLALLLDHIDELTLRQHEIRGNPAPLLGSFVARIDRLKEELVSGEDCRRWAARLAHDARDDAERARAEREVEFADAYLAHDELLAARGALDRGDLVLHAFRLLHRKPHVRRRVLDRLPHVLVDDYHDLTFAQGTLLRLLTGERPDLAVAADDDQALRRERGGARKNVEDFEREHGGEARVVRLERSHRCSRRVLAAAEPIAAGSAERIAKRTRGAPGGRVRFWRCHSPRAEAQAVAAEVERLLLAGIEPGAIGVVVRSLAGDGQLVAAALDERAVPARLSGAAAYFQRAEVRDVLAWLRLLADPGDAGAVVRALTRPPVELRSVDVARLTQLARRRKLDMVSAAAVACEGPQLSPEGIDRVRSFLRLYRAASAAFDAMRPDAFVHRLIERIGLRRRQVFAAQTETVERLVNIAKLSDVAAAYMRREPNATPRDLARYLAAVAEAGLPEEEAVPVDAPSAVRIVALDAAREREFDHVFVLGLGAGALDAAPRHPGVPDELRKESLEPAGAEEEVFEEELFGPAEGLHSTFRLMRDELLDTVSDVGGRLGEMRLDTYVDVSQAVARFLELLKVAALIERSKHGQSVAEALPEVNDILLQVATREQRELLESSALDEYLRDTARAARRRAHPLVGDGEASLESFIPRRGDGLMLSASDVETYRLCPLKYKFARVFRIPQEPTINQRFGILIHQVLERYHQQGRGSLEALMSLFEISWRRNGFGDSNDDLQFREKAVAALRRYWEADRAAEGEPVWFERSFSYRLGPHLVRGRVDRVDRLPDGSYELIDYKTGRAKSEAELSEDLQLSLYQMGARDSWRVRTSAQSYWYVLDDRKVPVAHSEEQLDRVRATVAEIGEGILAHEFEPKPSPDLCPFCDYRIICPAAEK